MFRQSPAAINLQLPAGQRLEIDGQRVINKDSAGENQVFVVSGIRVELDKLKVLPIAPNFGVGIVLPIDHGAREEFRWGLLTSVVFEY